MDTPTNEETEKQEQELNPLEEARKHQFKIFDLVGDGFAEEPEPEPEEKKEEPETPETKPAAETEPEEKKPEPEAKEKQEARQEPSGPKVTVRKKEKPLPDIPPFAPPAKSDTAPATQQQPQQQTSAPPAEPTDLMDDEREELELARFAEKEKPGAYQAGLDFILKRREFVKQRMAEEGRGYRPSLDPEYREWIEENAPLKPAQRKQLERRKLQEELREEIEQGNRRREEELRREIEALKRKPAIEKKSGQFRREIEGSLQQTLKEVFPEIEEAEGAVEEMRPLLEPVTERHANLVETFLGLNAGTESFDSRNATHRYINDFINEQARYFEANGGANLFKEGRRFVRPDVWPQVPQDKQHLYWTFTESDIVEVFAEKSRRETKAILAAERKKWEKFQKLASKKEETDRKQKPTGKQSPTSSPAPTRSRTEDLGPSAETSPSPGASGGSEHESPPTSFLSLLNG